VNNGLSAAGIALGLIGAIAVIFWIMLIHPVYGGEVIMPYAHEEDAR
jgi:hypothetical protein